MKQNSISDEYILKESEYLRNNEIKSGTFISNKSNFEFCPLLLSSRSFSDSSLRSLLSTNLSSAKALSSFSKSILYDENSLYLELAHATMPMINSDTTFSVQEHDFVDKCNFFSSSHCAVNTCAEAIVSISQASESPTTFYDNESIADWCYPTLGYDITHGNLMDSSSDHVSCSKNFFTSSSFIMPAYTSSFTSSASICSTVNTTSKLTTSAVLTAQTVFCADNIIDPSIKTTISASFPIDSSCIVSAQNYHSSTLATHFCSNQPSFLSRSASDPYLFLPSYLLYSSSSSNTSQYSNYFCSPQHNVSVKKNMLSCSNKNIKFSMNTNKNDIYYTDEDNEKSFLHKNVYRYKDHNVEQEKSRNNTSLSELLCLKGIYDKARSLYFKNTNYFVMSHQNYKENDNFICNIQNKKPSGIVNNDLLNIQKNLHENENICVVNNDQDDIKNNEFHNSTNNVYADVHTFYPSKNDVPTIENNIYNNKIKDSDSKNCLMDSHKSSNKMNNYYNNSFVQAPDLIENFENVINMFYENKSNNKIFNAVSDVSATSIDENFNNKNNYNDKKFENTNNIKKLESACGLDATDIHTNSVFKSNSTQIISMFDLHDDQLLNHKIKHENNKNMTNFFISSQNSDFDCSKGSEIYSNSIDTINFDQINNLTNYNDSKNKFFIESDCSEKLKTSYSSIYIDNNNNEQNKIENAQNFIKEKIKNKKIKTLKEYLEQQQKINFKNETTVKKIETEKKDDEGNDFCEKCMQTEKRKCLFFVYIKKFAIVFLDLWGGDDFDEQQKQKSEIDFKFNNNDSNKIRHKCNDRNIDLQLYNETNHNNSNNLCCNKNKNKSNKEKKNNIIFIVIVKFVIQLCKKVFFYCTKNIWNRIMSVLKYNKRVVVQEPDNNDYTNYNKRKDFNVKSSNCLLKCKSLPNNHNKMNCIFSKTSDFIESSQEHLQLNGLFTNVRKNMFFENRFFKDSRHHTFCIGNTQKRRDKVIKAEEKSKVVSGESKKRKLCDTFGSRNYKMFDSITSKQDEDLNNKNFNDGKCSTQTLNVTNTYMRIKSTSSTNISGVNGSKEKNFSKNKQNNTERSASINFLNASSNMNLKKQETTSIELLSFWNKQTEKNYRNYLNGFYPFRMLVVGIMLIIFEIFQILCSLIYKGGGVKNKSHDSYPMNFPNEQIHSYSYNLNDPLNEKIGSASSIESIWFVKMPESIFTTTMVTFVSNIVIYGVFSISGKIHFLKNNLEFSAVTLNAVAFILKFSNSLTVCLLTIQNQSICKSSPSVINNDNGSAIMCSDFDLENINNALNFYHSNIEDDEFAIEGEYVDTTTSTPLHYLETLSTLASASQSTFPISYAFDLFEGEFAILAFSIALNIIVIDLMLPVRTKVSIWLHVLYLGSNFILLVVVKELYSLEFSQIWHISVVCSCIIVIFGLMGRVQAEISHRRLYKKWIKSDERFKDLEEKIKSNHKGSTGVEKLVNYVNQSELLLRKVMINNNDDRLRQVLDFHAKIMETVTDGVNMYKLRLDLHDEHFSKVLKYIPGDPCLDICTPRSFSEKYFPPEENKMKLKSKSQILTTDDKLALFLPIDVFFHSAESIQTTSYDCGFNSIETTEIMENIGRDWGYNILSFRDKCGGNTILCVGTLLLRRLIVTNNCKDVGLRCSKRTLNNFLLKIQSLYITNPYHNECHGAQVAHSLHSLATMYFKKSEMATVDRICLIIGGLCHDVGHFGFTNQFLITDNHSLAITYNDMNILENYHSAIAFKIIHLPECNILKNMNEKVYRYIRLHVIELILATDMKYHFDYVSHLRVRRTAQNFDYIMDENDRWMVLKGCIKFADLSHASLPWQQHRQWSLNLAEEFFRQGDEELRRGLVVSNLCDRTKFSEFPKSQIGFINFVVFPLAEELFAVDRFGNFKKIVTKNMTQNCEEWMEVERQKLQDKLFMSPKST